MASDTDLTENGSGGRTRHRSARAPPASSTSRWPSARPEERPRERRSRVRHTASGSPPSIAPTRSSCSRSRPDARSGARPDPLWPHARVAVHVLSRRRLPDGVGSCERARGRASTRNYAAMPTCRISAASPRPTGSWSSASTTSTRRSPAPSSGTSNGSSPASPSRDAIAASTRSSGRPSTSRSAARTAKAFAGSPA